MKHLHPDYTIVFGNLLCMIHTKSHDLPEEGFEILRLKVIEHDLCKGLSIKIQHVTNHEILDYSK